MSSYCIDRGSCIDCGSSLDCASCIDYGFYLNHASGFDRASCVDRASYPERASSLDHSAVLIISTALIASIVLMISCYFCVDRIVSIIGRSFFLYRFLFHRSVGPHLASPVLLYLAFFLGSPYFLLSVALLASIVRS